MDAQEPILKKLTSEPLIIGKISGQRTIHEAQDVFTVGIDAFRNLNHRGPMTKATPVDVYELVRNATFAEMLESLTVDLPSLCLEQSQIIEFVQTNFKWLGNGDANTLFPFMFNGEIIFACVSNAWYLGLLTEVRPNQLYVYADWLRPQRRGCVPSCWFAKERHRLVVPRLTL